MNEGCREGDEESEAVRPSACDESAAEFDGSLSHVQQDEGCDCKEDATQKVTLWHLTGTKL
jgi:hypothetical protein